MKKYAAELLAIISIMLYTIPVLAQDSYTLYLNDGSYRRFHLDSDHQISTVKNGGSYLQCISTPDSTYYYAIEDIDSLVFVKYDIDRDAKRFAHATLNIDPIYSECNTVDDALSRIDEIKGIPYVEDAWCDENSLNVKIQDGNTVTYYFSSTDSDFSETSLSANDVIKSLNRTSLSNLDVPKVAVIYQPLQNEHWKWSAPLIQATTLASELYDCGMDVDFIEDFNLDFIREKITEYNGIYLMTHGGYDSKENLHKIVTGQQFMITDYSFWHDNKEDYLETAEESFKHILSVYNCNENEVKYSVAKETRDGKDCNVYYLAITEEFVKNQIKNRFDDRSILFNGACRSLYENSNMAKAFHNKGLSAYIGYTGAIISKNSATTGRAIFNNLLTGMSVEKAFDEISWWDSWEINVADWDELDLTLLAANFKNGTSRSVFLAKTETIEAEMEDYNDGQITIQGVVRSNRITSGKIRFGFIVSTSSSMANSRTYECFQIYDLTKNIFKYRQNISCALGETIYYQAYSYDGLHYNFGEVLSFTTPEDPSVTDFYANGIRYQITGSDEVEVILTDLGYEGDIVIPETISHAGKQYSVTSIGGYAFQYCRNLSSVTIGSRVKSIGEYAFEYCDMLLSVTIPDNVTTLHNAAFFCCASLKSVVIGNGVTSIGNSAFYGCKQLSSVLIGNKVKSIDLYAFMKCDNLSSIVIPDNVTTISAEAFAFCPALTSVVIGNGVASLEDCTFRDCKALSTVTIGNKVTDISIGAFRGCDNVKDLIYVNGCTTIVSTGLTSIENVILPSSATTIGESAFKMCDKLQSVTIPQNVLHIEEYAFYGCSKLTEITIPNSTKSIGFVAFYNCEGAKKITIGSGMETLAALSFYNTHPTDFYCYALTPPEADTWTFEDVPMESITLHVPSSALQAYKTKDPWKDFGSIVAIQ